MWFLSLYASGSESIFYQYYNDHCIPYVMKPSSNTMIPISNSTDIDDWLVFYLKVCSAQYWGSGSSKARNQYSVGKSYLHLQI